MANNSITFFTSNHMKVRIADEILSQYGFQVFGQKHDFLELQEINIDEICRYKISQVHSDGMAMVDDSGFYVKALNNFPGGLLKPLISCVGEAGILRLMDTLQNREAVYSCVLAFRREGKISVFKTLLEGKVSNELLGNRNEGWGIDHIFIPEGYEKTIGQFDDHEWRDFYADFKKKLHYNQLGIALTKNMK